MITIMRDDSPLGRTDSRYITCSTLAQARDFHCCHFLRSTVDAAAMTRTVETFCPAARQHWWHWWRKPTLNASFTALIPSTLIPSSLRE